MEFIADLHMHCLACDHGYNTIDELALEASKKGLKCIAVTEHGKATEDSPRIQYFINMHCISPYLHGVRVLHGAETGLTAPFGKPDLPNGVLKQLDFVIASMHGDGMPQRYNKSDYTNAYIHALENPYIDAIGHILRYGHDVYIEPVIKTAAANNKVIEVNEPTLKRPGYKQTLSIVLQLCKRHDIHIMLSSDAHHASLVGKFDNGIKLIEETGYPHELIINSSQERLLEYLNSRPLKNKITI